MLENRKLWLTLLFANLLAFPALAHAQPKAETPHTPRSDLVGNLYRLTKTFPRSLFVSPGDVHYTPEGYELIARQVAACIRAALRKATP
jgi:hypothetical protein